MSRSLPKPILYLITRGATTDTTSHDSPEFQELLRQISAAVAAGIDLIQIREKRLSARVLFALTKRAVDLSRRTTTRILVNDRADIAAAANAAGVHLSTKSLEPGIIRKNFGDDFLIGVSTHSSVEAAAARDQKADFVVFGPVFPTASKAEFGSPVGLGELRRTTSQLEGFPVLALGGVDVDNAHQCFVAGAAGVAGITLFSAPDQIAVVASRIKQAAKGVWE